MLVFWETTRACLLACRHCRASATVGVPAGELNTAEGRELIGQVAGFGRPYPILVLTGGDCLLRPDLFGLIGYAQELGVPVCLSPAVTPLLDAEELADIAALVASVGAHMWEVFFLVEVGRGRAVGAISPAGHEEVCHFLFDASRYGFVVRTVEAPFFRRTVLAGRNGCPPPDGSLYARLAGRLREFLGPPARPPSAHTAATRDGKGIMFISSTGDVYPAGFLPLSLGNVRERPLPGIYTDSPLLRDIRAARFHGRCGRCEHADLCGGSRARAYAATGDPLGEDPACGYEPVSGVPGSGGL